jgi:hypothetical protein
MKDIKEIFAEEGISRVIFRSKDTKPYDLAN